MNLTAQASAATVDPNRTRAKKHARPGDLVLATVNGASTAMAVGNTYPAAAVGRDNPDHPADHKPYRVVRVLPELDAVYGRPVDRPDGPWWLWNRS